MKAKTRRQDLDRAKGLGITLVVLGHIVARQPPRGNDWWIYLHSALYAFHMPFFMYLSGYVTFLSGAARTALPKWPALTRSRAYRLLLPFLLFGLAIVAGKALSSNFFYIDNLPSSPANAVSGLVWDTDHSPATSVWYMAVLFVFCVVTPLMMRLVHGNTGLILGLAVIIFVIPVRHILYADRVATYFVFFVLGGMAADAGQRWLDWVDRFYLLSLLLMVLILVIVVCVYDQSGNRFVLLACGLLSMPALHGLVRHRLLSNSRILLSLGTLSFVIYLLNTPCIGLVKGIMFKFMSWDDMGFLIFLPLLMVAGLFGPVAIKRLVLRRIPPLDRITN